MYFPCDIFLKNDPIFNSVDMKFRNKLIAHFDDKKNNVSNFISYRFDIVMPWNLIKRYTLLLHKQLDHFLETI